MTDHDFGLCQVCEVGKGVGAACSTMGPITLVYCRECLNQGADMLTLIHRTFDGCGGPEGIADWVKTIRSFKDGRYIDWDEIVACYVPDVLT